ncbi:MAG: hypothetical protein PHD04_03105 [Candidatus Pacebacteria bacterium]|nr:hypothetical protein [Candidatus Paceibacterota bacterium]
MFETHRHPLDPSKKVIGRHVEPGETLRSSDVQAADSGVWEPVPYEFIGTVVKESQRNTFVRPL